MSETLFDVKNLVTIKAAGANGRENEYADTYAHIPMKEKYRRGKAYKSVAGKPGGGNATKSTRNKTGKGSPNARQKVLVIDSGTGRRSWQDITEA